jgi:hypothetical protein
MKATSLAFIRRVSFEPTDDERPPCAFLHLSDDNDNHRYRVSVPEAFGRWLAERIELFNSDTEANIRLTIEVVLDADEREPGDAP